MRPTVLLPLIGMSCWLIAGLITLGTPIFWVWLLECVGVAALGALTLGRR